MILRMLLVVSRSVPLVHVMVRYHIIMNDHILVLVGLRLLLLVSSVHEVNLVG